MNTEFLGRSSSASDISFSMTAIASSGSQAKLKINHNGSLEPYAYAVGFGCKTNASVIVGGTADECFTPALLLSLADALNEAATDGSSILGFDVARIFLTKGVWIIPDFSGCGLGATEEFLPEKLDAKRLMELRLNGEEIRFNFRRNTPINEKLLAFLMASSCGYNINSERRWDDSSLCSRFSKELSRPAYSVKIGRDTPLYFSDIEPVLTRLLEAIMVFIAA